MRANVPKQQMRRSKTFWLAAGVLVLAGVLYNSWPLGYLVNPAVSRRGLASELEALHQPYNWLFISLDVVSGMLIMLAVAWLWRWASARIYKIALLSFAAFGLGTVVDALLPMSCEPSLTSCPSITHQPLLIFHGFFSIAASVCLFVSAVLFWWVTRRRKGAVVMSLLMLGWTAFGLVSIYFFFVPGPGYLAQHYYITLCSVWVAVLPFIIERTHRLAPAYAAEIR